MRPFFFLLALVAGFAGLLPAVPLTLPSSTCKLTLTDFAETLEAHRLWRVRFDGCLSFVGDPPQGFVLDSVVPSDCSIQLYHSLDRETKLQIRIYENEGQTRFTENALNAVLKEALESLPGRFQGKVSQPFEAGTGKGTPILGHISMEAELTLTDENTDETFLYRIGVVPSESDDYLLLAAVFSPADKFPVVNRSFEGFLRSLYEPSI